jgi:hypothetical protein
MILFHEDWKRFPNAIWDLKTSNKSFLEYSRLLYDQGVKNCLFPLALMQPALQGVDPHSTDLTDVQRLMIKMECTYNPWYFIREVMRVPPAAGDTPVPLIANRANISLWWCFLNHIDYFLIQPRQTGKSVNTDGISNWYQIFGAKNSRANLFTKNGDLIKENIARLKKIRKLLPPYLVEMHAKDTDNQKEFTNMAQGNRMVAVQAQKDEDSARNVGRGLTAPYNHTDEVAFLRFVHVSVPVMLAGSGAARDEARRNGMPFGNIFTTTAGKLDSEEGAFAYKLLQEGMTWRESLFDAQNAAELNRLVTAGCKPDSAPMINGTFSHRQLGFDDNWLRKKIAESRQSGDEVRRDYLNQWTAGSLTNPLHTSILEKIRAGVVTPTYEQKYSKEGYIVRWYLEVEEVLRKIPNRQLILGLDTSNAAGGDSITGVLVDVSTLEVAGVFSVNDSNLQVFAAWFARFLTDYKTVTVVPENKSSWPWIQDYLLIHLPAMGIDPGRRIHSTIVDNKDESDRDRKEYHEYSTRRASADHYNQYRTDFGFNTNATLRDMLYGPVIQEAGKKTASLVRDQVLANEICGLVTKNKRVDHSNGKHDDHVISWLLAHWFLSFAKNLDHYGIDPVMVKRKVFEAEHKLSWKEQREREQQEGYREEIQDLVEKMGGIRDDFALMKMQHRLESLYRKMDHSSFTAEFGSIDALIKEAAEKRSRTRSRAQSMREGLNREFRRDGGSDRLRSGIKNGRERVVVTC